MNIIRDGVTLEEARRWYKSDDSALRKKAILLFREFELEYPGFQEVKDIADAVRVLNIGGYESILDGLEDLWFVSHSASKVCELSLIRKALHVEYDLPSFEDMDETGIYYPTLHFRKQAYSDLAEWDREGVIGKLVFRGKNYLVFGGWSRLVEYNGLSNLLDLETASPSYILSKLIGCATPEIAQHFSKYFGMTILEAMVGDIKDCFLHSREDSKFDVI